MSRNFVYIVVDENGVYKGVYATRALAEADLPEAKANKKQQVSRGDWAYGAHGHAWKVLERPIVGGDGLAPVPKEYRTGTMES